MAEGTEIQKYQEDALALPDAQQVGRQLEAIRQFQRVCQQQLIQGHDYGIIPGTQRPTLLKPGAEKIAKLLLLADTYEILEKAEDWDKGFFAYTIRCVLTSLRTNQVFATGLGECNSMEARYRYRWVFKSELDRLGIQEAGLPKRQQKARGAWTTVYRIDNEDIYSQVNTILKMAKKRALVDAALSAGRLSDVFTQDMEDLREAIPAEEPEVVTPPLGAQGLKPASADLGVPAQEGDMLGPVFWDEVRKLGVHRQEQVTAYLGVNITVWLSSGRTYRQALETIKERKAVQARGQEASGAN